jgi:hypothetical protein
MSELDAIARALPLARHERQLGRAQLHLALVLSSLNAPRREIAPIAKAAVAWLQRAGVASDQISKLSDPITH